MSEQDLNEQLEQELASVQEDELTVLKKRATVLGISFGPNTGLDTLRKKVNDHLSASEPEPKQITPAVSEKQKQAQARVAARKEATKLVRVNVTCMNPNKKHLEGDFFSVSNSVIGTITKYIKFDTEDGFHVPNAILTVLREKQFQTFTEKKLPNGQKTTVGKLVKEYAIDVLDPLTAEELQELARRQAMAGSID